MTGNALAAELNSRVEGLVAVIEANASFADEARHFPVESIRALRQTGLLGIIVPPELGGLGGTVSDVVVLTQRLAGACLSTAFIFAMHCQQVAALSRFAGANLSRRLLPAVAAGEVYIASVTTESTGSSLFSADQPIREGPKDGVVTIHRDAPIVTGGAHADGFLIKMRSDSNGSSSGVVWCYATREQLTVTTGEPWRSLGMRGVENLAISLDGTIPTDQVIASGDAAHRISAEVLAPMAHLGWSAAWLGAAHDVFRSLLQSIRRGQLPQITVESELARHRLARVRLRLESASCYLHGALREVETSNRDQLPITDTATQIHLNTLKVLVAEQTYKAANEMIELVGLQTGYYETSPLRLERLLRDLRSASLNYDDTKLMSTIGGQCVLDTNARLLGGY